MSKKIIFIIVGVILLAEVIWGAWTLSKNSSSSTSSNQTLLPAFEQPKPKTTISLKTTKSEFKVGEEIPVTIELTSDKPTDGTDVIFTYDPKKLTLVPTTSKLPVAVGNMYGEYPFNKADETVGRISISGITSNPNGVSGAGILGTVTFKAKQAGFTLLSIDFVPGSTVDSNVIETKTTNELLSEVKNLEINILP